MKNSLIVFVLFLVAIFLFGCDRDALPTDSTPGTLANLSKPYSVELAALRARTTRYHRVEVAQSDGYNLIPGLDECVELPGVGGMGYHYINSPLVDTLVDALNPEVMVYHHGPNDQLVLGAVEYLVPAALWDLGHSEPPMLFGEQMHFNEHVGMYILHAWIWTNNPAGMFEDFNPRVTCP